MAFAIKILHEFFYQAFQWLIFYALVVVCYALIYANVDDLLKYIQI